MRATVKKNTEVAKGTRMVVFDLQGAEVDFTPGQYFFVNLIDPPYEDEKGPRRHFSVVTSPHERGVLGFATRIRDTAFKRSVAELEVGAEADVEEPKGSYVLPEQTDRPYAFIAGGIGITVFRCMLNYIADEGLGHRVTLVYSNRDRESTAFFEELQALDREYDNIRVVFTMNEDDSWEGETRTIDADMLRDHLNADLDGYVYLVAGPPGMVEGVSEMLAQAGIPEEQILPDRFSGY